VAQQIASQLRPGARVEIFSAGSSAISADIVALDARVDSATRNTTVRAKVGTTAQALTPGASVRVQVPIGPPRLAIAIPASAVRKGPEGSHVFVLINDADSTRVRMRRVQIDTTIGDETLVESGLSAGDRVAASGSFKLRDSALVAVIGESPAVAFNTHTQQGAAGANL
jgi:membrane fusion protein (multidrug efflux system)